MRPLILVVDDEPSIRDVLTEALSDEGFRVRSAPDGRQALDQVSFEPPDLIISDVSMPHMDGAEMVIRLRARGCATPVILISARYQAVDLPGVRFLPKPFDLDQLMDAVAQDVDDHGPSPVHGQDRRPGRPGSRPPG